MSGLGSLGFFFGGLGIFFAGLAALWWVTLQKKQMEKAGAS